MSSEALFLTLLRIHKITANVHKCCIHHSKNLNSPLTAVYKWILQAYIKNQRQESSHGLPNLLMNVTKTENECQYQLSKFPFLNHLGLLLKALKCRVRIGKVYFPNFKKSWTEMVAIGCTIYDLLFGDASNLASLLNKNMYWDNLL